MLHCSVQAAASLDTEKPQRAAGPLHPILLLGLRNSAVQAPGPNLHFCEFCSFVARAKAEQTCTFGKSRLLPASGADGALSIAEHQLAEVLS